MKRRNASKGLTTTQNGLVYKNVMAEQPNSPKQGEELRRKTTMFGQPITQQATLKVPEQIRKRRSTLMNEAPKPRDGHISLMLDKNMVVFGGDRHQVPFNDLYFLPLEKLE